MPLGRGIVEVFEAIPGRIEVSGHGPTWRVTGGSFESALAYADEAFGDTVVVAREDRRRWWPRVTLTVTRDPDLAADAPPVETFADLPEPEAVTSAPALEAEPGSEVGVPEPEPEPEPGSYESTLDEIFARQEARRAARRRIPEQRSRG